MVKHGMLLWVLGCVLALSVAYGQAIPYRLDPITSADAARPVRVSMDGDVAAVIENGNPREGGGSTNNLLTFYRDGTNWTEVDILPAPGRAFSVDVKDCRMAVGLVGTATVWSISCGSSKPGWLLDSTIALSNHLYRVVGADLDGSRLALLVDRSASAAGYEQSVYLYDASGPSWIYRAEIGVALSNAIDGLRFFANAMDLDGDRLAIASPFLNTIQIHEKDQGGLNAWGRVASVSNAPAGMIQLGYSLALDGDRLAASAVEAASQRPTVLVYSNNTGGVGNWGFAGTLLGGQDHATRITLDTDGSRLAALSLPELDALFMAGRVQQLWVFEDGVGPGGWVLEHEQPTGPFAWSLYDYAFNSILMPMRPSISGNRLMLGQPGTNGFGNKSGWEASVYEMNNGGAGQWGREAGIAAPGSPVELGSSLDMDGPFLVAGMPGDDWNGTNTGSAYVWYLYESGGSTIWYPVARLIDQNGEPGHQFGYSVAIEQTDDFEARVAVGAPFEFAGKGAVYLFDVSAVLGQQAVQRRITPTPYLATNAFGLSVALDGDYLAVGAPSADTINADAGAIYLFEKDVGGVDAWGCRKTNAPPTSGLFYGTRVDVQGSNLAVTRPNSAGAGQAVFVYGRDTGGTHNWGLKDTITPPPGSPDSFAWSVDFVGNGSSLLVGAIDVFAPVTNGVVYFFATQTGDVYQVLLEIDDPAGDGPYFGYDVAWIDFTGPLVGAYRSMNGGTSEVGTARLFGLSVTGGVTNVTLMATMAGSNAFDRLGYDVAGWGIYAVASAPRDDFNGSNAGEIQALRVGAYEIWAASQPSAFANQWLPWENYDDDEDANLMEFAMGTDPMNPASNRKLVMFPFRNALGTPLLAWEEPDLPYSTLGLDYNMQAGPDMVQWTGVTGSPATTNGMTLRLYSTTEPLRHFRLAPRYPAFGAYDPGGGIIILEPAD